MTKDGSKVETMLQDLLILQLALAGVSGAEIRMLVGVKMDRVTRMLKSINKARGK
jgi:hypothetical protein